MKVVILAGGQGSRFWPLSTKRMPKQFLHLYSDGSMLQKTYQRFRSFLSPEKIFILTVEPYLSIIQGQLPEISMNQIILEPEQRDTGPCIALTALFFLNHQDDEVLVFAPSDHFIGDTKVFHRTLIQAVTVAEEKNSVVTLGIRPTAPKTGYGYIQILEKNEFKPGVFKVEKFIEKPDILKAEKLILQKNVFWNSGIFIWKPSTIAASFGKYQRDMWHSLYENKSDVNKIYSSLPKISIDYAILEKAENVYLVSADFSWDDLGTWTSLERFIANDDNLCRGEVVTNSANNCIVYTDRKTLLIGVDDLIVASTNEGVLVCHKSEEQKIKELLHHEYQNKRNSKFYP